LARSDCRSRPLLPHSAALFRYRCHPDRRDLLLSCYPGPRRLRASSRSTCHGRQCPQGSRLRIRFRNHLLHPDSVPIGSAERRQAWAFRP
jgi:hypothetical protein